VAGSAVLVAAAAVPVADEIDHVAVGGAAIVALEPVETGLDVSNTGRTVDVAADLVDADGLVVAVDLAVDTYLVIVAVAVAVAAIAAVVVLGGVGRDDHAIAFALDFAVAEVSLQAVTKVVAAALVQSQGELGVPFVCSRISPDALQALHFCSRRPPGGLPSAHISHASVASLDSIPSVALSPHQVPASFREDSGPVYPKSVICCFPLECCYCCCSHCHRCYRSHCHHCYCSHCHRC